MVMLVVMVLVMVMVMVMVMSLFPDGQFGDGCGEKPGVAQRGNPRHSSLDDPGTRFEHPCHNVTFKIGDMKYKRQSKRKKIQNTKYKTQDVKCEIQ